VYLGVYLVYLCGKNKKVNHKGHKGCHKGTLRIKISNYVYNISKTPEYGFE
jgi:hypothetical protein